MQFNLVSVNAAGISCRTHVKGDIVSVDGAFDRAPDSASSGPETARRRFQPSR